MNSAPPVKLKTRMARASHEACRARETPMPHGLHGVYPFYYFYMYLVIQGGQIACETPFLIEGSLSWK